MNGDVWLGPNAVLAFKREGYKLMQFNPTDLFDAVSFRSGCLSVAALGIYTLIDNTLVTILHFSLCANQQPTL